MFLRLNFNHTAIFLLLASYVPNIRGEEEYMTSVYVYIDDRPTTDLASWKISHGHISATGRPIASCLVLG